MLPQNWIRHITNLFNAVLEKEEAPDSWSKVISMIFKKGDSTNPENYRGKNKDKGRANFRSHAFTFYHQRISQVEFSESQSLGLRKTKIIF